MPTKESLIHSQGSPLTYPLKRGGEVTIRNGVAYRGNEPLATNGSVVEWLREHSLLTADQAYWLPYVIRVNSVTTSATTVPREGGKHGGAIK